MHVTVHSSLMDSVDGTTARILLNILFLFLFEITDLCDRVSLYSSGCWWACSSPQPPQGWHSWLAQLAGVCLLFLTHVVPGLSTVWPAAPLGSFYLHSLLLAGHELWKVCQGLLRPASGPGLSVTFSSHWPISGDCPLWAGDVRQGCSGFSRPSPGRAVSPGGACSGASPCLFLLV